MNLNQLIEIRKAMAAELHVLNHVYLSFNIELDEFKQSHDMSYLDSTEKSRLKDINIRRLEEKLNILELEDNINKINQMIVSNNIDYHPIASLQSNQRVNNAVHDSIDEFGNFSYQIIAENERKILNRETVDSYNKLNAYKGDMQVLEKYDLDVYFDEDDFSIDQDSLRTRIDDMFDEGNISIEEKRNLLETISRVSITFNRYQNANSTRSVLNQELANSSEIVINDKKQKDAEQIVEAMANGQIDTNGQPIVQNQEIISNNRTMGFAKVWILGILTTIASIGIIVLGVFLNK